MSTCLIDKISCKKQKKDILKKKLLIIMHTKKAVKEKSRERYKDLPQEKKTRLKSIKEKKY